MSDQSTVQKLVSGALDITRKDTSSSESDADSVTSDRPPVDLYPEEGELSDEPTPTNPCQRNSLIGKP